MTKLFTCLLAAFCVHAVHAQSGSETFTSSGSFTVPEGVTTIKIEVVGAGGSGNGNGTGGGGGGGYASGNYTVTPFDVLSVTVGTPGSGAVAGTTSVGDLLYATGGENGISVPNPEIGGGGTGGMGSGGNIDNFSGGNGGGGYYTYFGGGGGGAAGIDGNGTDGGNTIAWTGICLTPGGDGGLSGGVPGGDGGKGAGFTDVSCIETDPAGDGLTYGGGGGGGNGNGGGPGDGAGGYCVISWLHCEIDISTTVTGDSTITATEADLDYQWVDCNNGYSYVIGGVFQSFTPEETGDYAVILREGECVDTSACVHIEVEIDTVPNGISLNENFAVNVFPNPFTDLLHFEPALQNATVQLINTTGQVIWEGTDPEQKDFSALMPGLYIMKIEYADQRFYRTLMKE